MIGFFSRFLSIYNLKYLFILLIKDLEVSVVTTNKQCIKEVSETTNLILLLSNIAFLSTEFKGFGGNIPKECTVNLLV